jgi:enoyl-CoA hydratase/carnithine racemase
MREALRVALARVAADPAVRAAVLTATGDTFYPGADLWGGGRDAREPSPGMAGGLLSLPTEVLHGRTGLKASANVG